MTPPSQHSRIDAAGTSKRRWGWTGVLLGFLAGFGLSHVLGFWGFLISLAHGIPAPDHNGIAVFLRSTDPAGFSRAGRSLKSPEDSEVALATCVVLERPKFGLETAALPCSPARAEFRIVPGVSPTASRLATARPLLGTQTATARAPVAGWAARIDGAD